MRKRVAAIALLLPCLALAPPASADDEFDSLEREFRAAQQRFYEQLQKLGADSKEPGAPASMPVNPSKEFAPRFRAYAEKRAKTDDAVPALVWILGNAEYGSGAVGPDVRWALQTLTENHAASPRLVQQLPQLRYTFYQVGMDLLTPLYERVISENPDRSAKAAAMFNLAFGLYSSAAMPADLPGAATSDATANRKRADAMFRQIANDYGDTDTAKIANAFIFELDHLQIGMKAPEITGSDVNEKEIKLSQFRGHVVVIDFWGFW